MASGRWSSIGITHQTAVVRVFVNELENNQIESLPCERYIEYLLRVNMDLSLKVITFTVSHRNVRSILEKEPDNKTAFLDKLSIALVGRSVRLSVHSNVV